MAALESLRLEDYSDRELLFIVLDQQSPKTGYATTEDIAKTLGMEGDHPHQSVGVRLAWLRKFGAIAKRDGTSHWAVTKIGEDLIKGKLNPGQEQLLKGAESSELLMLTRALTQRSRRAGITASHLIRREWKRGN